MKHPRLRLAAGIAAAALALAACGSSTSASSSSSSSSSSSAAASGSTSSAGSSAAGGGGSSESIIVGSANFGESELLMNIYAGALKAKGVTVTTKPKIGSREVYIKAIQDGSIDLVPEYSGTLLKYFDPKATAVSSADVFAALPAAIGAELKVLDQSKAEDKDSITVTADTASKYSLKAIGDLKDHAADLILGAAPEFKTRVDGVPGLKAKYGVEFGTFKVLDAGGPLTVNALKNGQIDAGDIFTTDPAIAANKFVILADPLNLFNAQNVLPLISAKKATPTVTAALNAVSAKLDTATLQTLNATVAGGTDSAQAAQDWLKAQGLA